MAACYSLRMNHLLILFFLLSSAFASAYSLGRDPLPPSPVWSKGIEFGTQGFYLVSDSNYITSGGEFERLANENDISSLGLELFANYSFNRNLRIISIYSLF